MSIYPVSGLIFVSISGLVFSIYPVSGLIFVHISGIRSDICPDIRYPARYLSKYPISDQIFVQLSGIRPDTYVGYLVNLISGPSLYKISDIFLPFPPSGSEMEPFSPDEENLVLDVCNKDI